MTQEYEIKPMTKYIVGGGYINGFGVSWIRANDWTHFDTEEECHQFASGEIDRFGDDC